MAVQADTDTTGATKYLVARDLAPLAAPTTAKEAPKDWAQPKLWTPGELMCVAIAVVRFDDPQLGRVSLDVSIWRDPLDPRNRYSAMVENWLP